MTDPYDEAVEQELIREANERHSAERFPAPRADKYGYLDFLYEAEPQEKSLSDQKFEDLLIAAFDGFERLRATRDSAALAACNKRLSEVHNGGLR